MVLSCLDCTNSSSSIFCRNFVFYWLEKKKLQKVLITLRPKFIMGWRNLPIWLRGGIFGLIVPVIIFLLAFISSQNLIYSVSEPEVLKSIGFMLFSSPNPVYLWFNLIVFWFFIGVVIGTIVEILKKKSKKR